MKKLLIISVILIALFIVGGCSFMDKNDFDELYQKGENIIAESTGETAKKVTELLSIKYKDEFSITRLGNRINTENVDVYAKSKTKKDIVFKARINLETLELRDNYIERIVGLKFSDILNSALDKNGIKADSRFTFSSDTSEEYDTDITVEEFLDIYKAETAFVFLVISKESLNKSTAEKLVDVLCRLSEKYGFKVVINGYVYSENYKKTVEELKEDPDPKETRFTKNNPDNKIAFAIKDGKPNVDILSIKKMLK